MPIYTVTSIAGRFSPAQKERLAAAITSIHCSVTGTLPHLVQVIFHEVAEGDIFVAGRHMKYDNIAIVGLIRAGRRSDAKRALLLDIMHSAAAIAETDRTAVQVYIAVLPGRQIAEWGRLAAQNVAEPAADPDVTEELRARIRSLNG